MTTLARRAWRHLRFEAVYARGRRRSPDDHVMWFAMLTLPEAPTRKDFDGRDDVAALLARTRAAKPDEIASVVRAVLPDPWAREQMLVEERAAFAARARDTR